MTTMARKTARRLIVISDLHLGGRPPMMGRPKLLASFIDALPSIVEPHEALELVIAGDFVDFLAIEKYSALTTDPWEACAKLATVMDGPGSEQACIFDALAHVAGRHRLTILLGNHDVELVLPAVQEALLQRLSATPHRALFVDDGRAYRVGSALIEHGNAHDGANANDWDALLHVASAQSRFRDPECDAEPSPGSVFVEQVVDGLKSRYPFISLLQPEGELHVLLLMAFEPTLRGDLNALRRAFRAERLSKKSKRRGVRPIANEETDAPDAELTAAFGEDYLALRRAPEGRIGAGTEWLRAWLTPSRDSLRTILEEGRPIPADRLQRLRVALRKLPLHGEWNLVNGPAGRYGQEANRILDADEGVRAVVMGHTHLPRCKPYRDGIYINTGTWIDRIQVPAGALADGADGELTAFLASLLQVGGIPPLDPTYADLSVGEDSQLLHARLMKVGADGSRAELRP